MHTGSVIVIVGGGAAGVAAAYHLVDEAAKREAPPHMTIYVVESRPRIGAGNAYEADWDTNLMNTRAGVISPVAGDPGHFLRWASENQALWQDDFPGWQVDADRFVPRPLLGLYLEHVFTDTCRRALRLGSRIVPVHAEVVDIDILGPGDLLVQTTSHLTIRANQVVLCQGHLPSREMGPLLEQPGVYATPYPVRRVARAIDRQATVALVGSRLSAVDAMLGLAAAGHQGPIHCFSRSGRLPSVRGTQERYTPKIMTLDTVRRLVASKGRLSLAEMAALVRAEIELAEGKDFDFRQFFAPPADPLTFLDSEIAAAERPRMWQAVLYASNAIMEYAWHYLEEADKLRFARDHFSHYISFRVSIPVENAIRMRDLMRAGRVQVHAGAVQVAANAEGGFLVSPERGGAPLLVDTVIGCLGTPRDATRLDSPLLERLFAKGFSLPERFGGIQVDHATGQVRGHGGCREDLLAIGDLTAGTHFFTSVLEVLARHAQTRAAAILDRLAGSSGIAAEAPVRQAATG